ncbi:unnamed protein product [Protopolystoma xenopodis]|uniref:Reverse transcriptase domain-containing protein n=1 Tax=Protopolystoma xenopodis TaxID=117903 RepID=A0A3S5B823_9PLAT|nr:unnamed protein product [Protopolystoma xenopodis]
MDEVTCGLEGVSVYLDDILIASCDKEQHKKLSHHHLVNSPEKCVFYIDSLTFFGHPSDAQSMLPRADSIVAYTLSRVDMVSVVPGAKSDHQAMAGAQERERSQITACQWPKLTTTQIAMLQGAKV